MGGDGVGETNAALARALGHHERLGRRATGGRCGTSGTSGAGGRRCPPRPQATTSGVQEVVPGEPAARRPAGPGGLVPRVSGRARTNHGPSTPTATCAGSPLTNHCHAVLLAGPALPPPAGTEGADDVEVADAQQPASSASSAVGSTRCPTPARSCGRRTRPPPPAPGSRRARPRPLGQRKSSNPGIPKTSGTESSSPAPGTDAPRLDADRFAHATPRPGRPGRRGRTVARATDRTRPPAEVRLRSHLIQRRRHEPHRGPRVGVDVVLQRSSHACGAVPDRSAPSPRWSRSRPRSRARGRSG